MFGQVPLENLLQEKGVVSGSIDVEGKPFAFHNARCFYDTWQELVVNNMYEFKTKSSKPYILDCGANLGLSVYYFARLYPQAEIIAFEPEVPIYEVLERNVATYGLKQVQLVRKAVWESETTLSFYTDEGMGGSVTNVYSNQQPTHIETVRLADYLTKRVDMLKMDIEGAEYTVLKSCSHLLHLVDHLFVEYHSYINQPQQLDDLLLLLKEAGFRYHLKESFSMKRPFVERHYACENMDMAINVFAYRD